MGRRSQQQKEAKVLLVISDASKRARFVIPSPSANPKKKPRKKKKDTRWSSSWLVQYEGASHKCGLRWSVRRPKCGSTSQDSRFTRHARNVREPASRAAYVTATRHFSPLPQPGVFRPIRARRRGHGRPSLHTYRPTIRIRASLKHSWHPGSLI